MISIRSLITAILLSVPFTAASEPSTVQSGEHDGFTRLVAVVPANVRWRVEKTGDTVKLTLTGHADGFDTSRVFDRIARNRVGALEKSEDVLTLTLACACNVSAFAVGSDHVAIDVVGKGVPYNTAFLKESRDGNLTTHADKTHPSATSLPIILSHPATEMTLPREGLSEQEEVILTETQQELARELGSAATRGILEQSVILPRLAKGDIYDETPGIDTPLAKPDQSANPVDENIKNMRITSSMDLPDLSVATHESLSEQGFICPPDADIDIATWAGDAPFHAQVGAARKHLFGEFDRLNTDVALSLAQTYLHFGFGAEARQLLTLDPELAKQQKLLIAIADIMEHGVPTNYPQLRRLYDCGTDVALWAILALDGKAMPGAMDTGAALLGLNKLPSHLRSFLAPALSRRLLEYGDTAAAATAMRSLERLPGAMSAAGKFALAEVSIDEGQDEEGQAQLADVIDDNAAQSPEALIALVDARVKSQQPIDHETAGLVAAYAQEMQETELGPELRRAHVLALVKSGQFDAAFIAARNLGGDEETRAATDLRILLIQELTAAADDVVFLDRMFQLDDADIAELPNQAKLSVAERYLGLGFPVAAQRVVDTVPDRPRNPVRQILAARTALALDRPASAQASLIGMSGQNADMLRAKAKAMSGAHDEAAELYRQTNQPEEAARTAWLAENWQTLVPKETPVFGPVAALSTSPVIVDPAYEGMLTRTQDALKESIGAREMLLELLRAPTLQIAPVVTPE